MFLKLLNKVQKENFLELAYLTAKSGDHFEEPEEAMIREFRYEMHLGEDEYEIKGKKLEEILEGFDDADLKLKISVFIELIALVLCDEEFDKQEQEMMLKIKNKFGISDVKYDEVINWVKELQGTYKKVTGIFDV